MGPAAAKDAAGRPAAAGHTAAGVAAGLLAETLATALVRADRAATGADHGVRGYRFWAGFQEREVLEFGSLLGAQPPLYPAKELLSLLHYFLVIIYPTRKT